MQRGLSASWQPITEGPVSDWAHDANLVSMHAALMTSRCGGVLAVTPAGGA